MHNTLKRAVIATNQKAQYDAKVKNLLGHKIILAHILTRTVDEFKGMNPREVIPYIEGTPYISKVPIEPGMTNHEQQGQQIIGLNTENVEINEGLIRFDIIFYVRLPSEDSKDAGLTQIIINVEAQKDEPKGNLDLLNIIMLGLAKNLPEHDETYELHRLLGALLSKELTIDEKLNIIGNEYDIPIEENFRKDVSVMCNLSQGIKEDGIAIGEAGLIMKMYKNGFTAEQIASATDKDIEEVKAIIAGKEPALA